MSNDGGILHCTVFGVSEDASTEGVEVCAYL